MNDDNILYEKEVAKLSNQSASIMIRTNQWLEEKSGHGVKVLINNKYSNILTGRVGLLGHLTSRTELTQSNQTNVVWNKVAYKSIEQYLFHEVAMAMGDKEAVDATNSVEAKDRRRAVHSPQFFNTLKYFNCEASLHCVKNPSRRNK
uniref:Uncharacterized protein n=1 Tax=Romanomermis culicivorax TaxID=13658 RepID=A0A915KXD6_ROMCU